MVDIINQTSPSMPLELPVKRVQRVRHELKLRELLVHRVREVSPALRRVTFVAAPGHSLHDFVSASFDDHVKLMFDAGDSEPVRRDYTPRRFDAAAGELDIEFALHGHGPASAWAAQAAPGQTVRIGGPRGSFVIDPAHDWHLLVGDESALPAIARRLEELPAGARAIVRVRLPDGADVGAMPALASRAGLDVQWLPGHEPLCAALRALAWPAGEGYAWCAGEAAEVAHWRRILVDERGHPPHAIRAAAYWKQGRAAHHENLEG